MNVDIKIDDMKDEIIKCLQGLIRIQSTEDKAEEGMPFGKGPARALKYMLDLSEKLGFKTVNMENYVGYAEYGDAEEYIAVVGHVDVVPAGNGWTYPPYSAEIHDNKIYGRGASDDKGPILAALFALKAIKESGITLNKKVRIIFGTNEESECKELRYYLKKELPPVAGFTPDSFYPVVNGEKGFTFFDLVKVFNKKQTGGIKIKYIRGGHVPNMVPDYCEAGIEAPQPCKVKEALTDFKDRFAYDIDAEVTDKLILIKSRGISVHGSTPERGKNAIMQLFAFLETLNLNESDISSFISFMNKNAGLDPFGKSFGVGLEDKISGKLSFNIGTISMDEERVKMELNLRYPVSFKLEDMINPINERIKGTGIRIENLEDQPPVYFPPEHPLIKTLMKVYNEYTGKNLKPLVTGSGSYAKEMPDISGFGPSVPGHPHLAHEVDEYMSIDDLLTNTKIYSRAIYELAK